VSTARAMSCVGQDKSVDAGPSRDGRRLLPNDGSDSTCCAAANGWVCKRALAFPKFFEALQDAANYCLHFTYFTHNARASLFILPGRKFGDRSVSRDSTALV